MAFTTQCNNKGCGKLQDPYIDPKTDKVYCNICNQELTNITYFTKTQLKSLKQYKQAAGKSFAVKCLNCNNDDRPVKKDQEYVCSNCKSPLNISHAFKVTLDAYLGSTTKEI